MTDGDKTVIPIAPEAVPVGTELSGTYRLDERIASGGMGEVFRGHNIHTGDPVAIKIVLPEFARDATILALFRKEATILRRLAHEAIVRYEIFTIDQGIGRPYLAMEFVDGTSLVDMFTRGPMAPAEARRLLARLAAGMAAAHEAGVVHRDLSPDNVILPGGRVDRAKIIDFGIARSPTIGGETLIGDTFAGKYNFVSPEQLGMANSQVSERSDIYSLGLVIAAALRGGPIDMSGSPLDVLEKRRAVPDLSALDPTLRPILEAMLQPDPQDRPAGMAEVVAQVARLDPAQTPETTSTSPVSNAPEADLWHVEAPPEPAPPPHAQPSAEATNEPPAPAVAASTQTAIDSDVWHVEVAPEPWTEGVETFEAAGTEQTGEDVARPEEPTPHEQAATMTALTRPEPEPFLEPPPGESPAPEPAPAMTADPASAAPFDEGDLAGAPEAVAAIVDALESGTDMPDGALAAPAAQDEIDEAFDRAVGEDGEGEAAQSAGRRSVPVPAVSWAQAIAASATAPAEPIGKADDSLPSTTRIEPPPLVEPVAGSTVTELPPEDRTAVGPSAQPFSAPGPVGVPEPVERTVIRPLVAGANEPIADLTVTPRATTAWWREEPHAPVPPVPASPPPVAVPAQQPPSEPTIMARAPTTGSWWKNGASPASPPPGPAFSPVPASAVPRATGAFWEHESAPGDPIEPWQMESVPGSAPSRQLAGDPPPRDSETAATTGEPASARGRGRLLAAVLAGLVVLIAISGGGAWYLGLFGTASPPPAEEPLPAAAAPTPEEPATPAPSAVEPTAAPSTGLAALASAADRIAWLDGYSGGPCFFAGATSVAGKGMAMQGFGQSEAPFRDLVDAYETKFGAEAQMTVQLIRPAQCVVTDFLAKLRGSPVQPPSVQLADMKLANRQPMTGEVELAKSMRTYLLLVDDDGVAHNITSYLGPGPERSLFTVPIALDEKSRPAPAGGIPQLLIALSASGEVKAIEKADSEPASDLLPDILREMQAGKVEGAASARYFLIE